MEDIRNRRGDLDFHEKVWPTETAVRERADGGFDSDDGLDVDGDVRKCSICDDHAGALRTWKISRKISIIFHGGFGFSVQSANGRFSGTP